VEESIAKMEYELTHESLSAEREKMLREKKERAEKHDRPAAMRMAQVSTPSTLCFIGVSHSVGFLLLQLTECASISCGVHDRLQMTWFRHGQLLLC
jgi:hypothetical protein